MPAKHTGLPTIFLVNVFSRFDRPINFLLSSVDGRINISLTSVDGPSPIFGEDMDTLLF